MFKKIIVLHVAVRCGRGESMTESKAVEVLEYVKTFDGMDFGATKTALDMAIQALEEIQAYQAIGTVEELRELKEKAEPKKPKMKPLRDFDSERDANWCSCPNCFRSIGWEYERHFNFCNECGTEFDWQ